MTKELHIFLFCTEILKTFSKLHYYNRLKNFLSKYFPSDVVRMLVNEKVKKNNVRFK